MTEFSFLRKPTFKNDTPSKQPMHQCFAKNTLAISWAARFLCAETAFLLDKQFTFGALCTHSPFKSPLPWKMNFFVADNYV